MIKLIRKTNEVSGMVEISKKWDWVRSYHHLPIGNMKNEEADITRRRGDGEIKISPNNDQTFCLIEAKIPNNSEHTNPQYRQHSWEKAVLRSATVLAFTNFQEIEVYIVNDYPSNKSPYQVIPLCDITNLDDLNLPEFDIAIKIGLQKFAELLISIRDGKKPKIYTFDQHFINTISFTIPKLQEEYEKILQQTSTITETKKQIELWFQKNRQLCTFSSTDLEFLSFELIYDLILKVMYYCMKRTVCQDLGIIFFSEKIDRMSTIQFQLEGMFRQATKIIGNTFLEPHLLSSIIFTENHILLYEWKKIINFIASSKLNKLDANIYGRLFENLIPSEFRKKFGQYFTKLQIADLIISFCNVKSTDIIMESSCGSGMFCSRVYKRLSGIHAEKLTKIYGFDIASLPARMTTLNLLSRDIHQNVIPNIIQADFFHMAKEIKRKKQSVIIPSPLLIKPSISLNPLPMPLHIDASIGNPPYVRNEERSDTENKNGQEGMHIMFIRENMAIMDNGGKLGYIVSNTWLDNKYGMMFQKELLENVKIIAIIEPKTELWFEDADTTTCIIIMEKCTGNQNKEKRMNNVVRFIQTIKPIMELIGEELITDEEERERLRKIDEWVDHLLRVRENMINDDYRITIKTQQELWDAGYDRNEYIGSKWGIYLRAPDVYFKIMQEKKHLLIKISTIADVRFGVKTGSTEFFYLTKEQAQLEGIEPQYLRPAITSPTECDTYSFDASKVKWYLLNIHEPKEKLVGNGVLKYIEKGEKPHNPINKKDDGCPYSQRESCNKRLLWYAVAYDFKNKKEWNVAPILFGQNFRSKIYIMKNSECVENDQLYGVTPKDNKITNLMMGILSSTLLPFFVILNTYDFAQAITNIKLNSFQSIYIPNPYLLNESIQFKIIKAFDQLKNNIRKDFDIEFGTDNPEEIDLAKIDPIKRSIDKIVMEEILGLSEDDQKEIYKFVLSHIQNKVERSKSSKKSTNGYDVNSEEKTSDLILTQLYKKIDINILLKNTIQSSFRKISSNHTHPLTECYCGIGCWGIRERENKKQIIQTFKNEYHARIFHFFNRFGYITIQIPDNEVICQQWYNKIKQWNYQIITIMNNYFPENSDQKWRDKIMMRVYDKFGQYIEHQLQNQQWIRK